MEILLETIRDEIGACLEISYEHISLKDAQKRLNYKTEREVVAFGKKVSFSKFVAFDEPEINHFRFSFAEKLDRRTGKQLPIRK